MWSASVRADGRTVVTASGDKTARLWDAQTGQEIQRLPHEDMVQAAAFSPTDAPSSPVATTIPPGCGTPEAGRNYTPPA